MYAAWAYVNIIRDFNDQSKIICPGDMEERNVFVRLLPTEEISFPDSLELH